MGKPSENQSVDQYRVQWSDQNGKVIDLSGRSLFDRFALINERRRLKVEDDCRMLLRTEDQGDFICSRELVRIG